VADVAWDSPGMLLLVLSVEGKLAVFSRDGLVARVVARQVVVYPLRAISYILYPLHISYILYPLRAKYSCSSLTSRFDANAHVRLGCMARVVERQEVGQIHLV